MYQQHQAKTKEKNTINITLPEDAKQVIAKILQENPEIEKIMHSSLNYEQFLVGLKNVVNNYFDNRPEALKYYNGEVAGRDAFNNLNWRDFGAIRLLDYLDHEGNEYEDLNLRGKTIINQPMKLFYLAAKEGKGDATADFFLDILYLFRQFRGTIERSIPSKEEVVEWMDRHPSGLDPEIIDQRKKNKDRIIRIFIKMIDAGDIKRSRFTFDEEMTYWQKYRKVSEWWNDSRFHLQLAIRTPELLNELLDNTLDNKTLAIFKDAQKSGIPFFVNPYYLSLLNVNIPEKYEHSDAPIRDYVMVSRELVDEFGHIVAWEKEDQVKPGKPNAAGWLLPNEKNIHRRYPEVAILIPDTVGRACGGLCVSCQRMYDFQNGHLNFDLDKLKPKGSWWDRLPQLMEYYEKDSKLRDILITGGDALMSTDRSLKRILDEVLKMAEKKKAMNEELPDGKKVAQMLRIRLGTRLPVYLPQRITDDLVEVLAEFRNKALELGFKQFVIQTHFESAMEVTPEAAEGIRKIISSGWTITNQLVFTAAASRRGHTAKLRKVLNDVGVLTYYTFTVKGYQENSHTFANNARAVQEQIEEKYIGEIPDEYRKMTKTFPESAKGMVENIDSIRQICNVPFIATDRNVINLPGVGKSLTYRTIGITSDGRRILEFDHDHTRQHSPIIDKMGKVIIIESRSIASYLNYLESIGENKDDYTNVWGYSIGETEPRAAIYEYPEFSFKTTGEFTNLEV